MMISIADSRQLTFTSDSLNQTYTSVRFYGRNQNTFTRLTSKNNSNVNKLTQRYNPNFHPIQHSSEPSKSSSTKDYAVSDNADLFLDTEDFRATKKDASLRINPWNKKDYEISSEKKANYHLKFSPNIPTSKMKIPFGKQSLDFFKPFSSFKTYHLKNYSLERQSNVLKVDESKGSKIDSFNLEFSSVVPLKNVTRPNRQSQQQNVLTTTGTTTGTTTVAATATTTATTSAATTAATTATTTAATTLAATATTSAATTVITISATTTTTTSSTTSSSTVSTTSAKTTTTTTAQPNSCYTQTCDQTITGRQLSYTRFV